MKKLFAVLCLFLFQLGKANPVDNFIKQNHNINSEKFILITLNIQNCESCSYPIQTIVSEIRQHNNSVPIYLITNENLNEGAKKFYLNQLGFNADSINLICNQELYDFLLNKTNKVDNISVITSKGKINLIKKIDTNLKLEGILTEFNDRLHMKAIEIMSITNIYTDYSKSFSAIVYNANKFIIFKQGINILSIYDYKGNSKNIHLDTLPICKVSFFKTIVTSEEFKNSRRHYDVKKNTPHKLLTPVSIFKLSEGEFGITYYLKVFKDSVYKKDSVIYESERSFIVVLDTNFKIKNILKFNDTYASKMILEAQSAYSDSTFYLMFSEGINKYALGQFKIGSKQELVVDTIKTFHFSTGESAQLPIIQNCNINNRVIFTIYGQAGENSSEIFQIKKTGEIMPLSSLKKKYVYGSMIYPTERGNLIYGANSNGKFQLEKLILNNDSVTTKTSAKDPIRFIFDGKLYQIQYCEK